MKKFVEFLKNNVVFCIIGCIIYWGIPYIVIILLGVLVSPYYFTLIPATFGVQVALPAIPIIIGISLFVKGIFTLKKGRNKNGRK